MAATQGKTSISVRAGLIETLVARPRSRPGRPRLGQKPAADVRAGVELYQRLRGAAKTSFVSQRDGAEPRGGGGDGIRDVLAQLHLIGAAWTAFVLVDVGRAVGDSMWGSSAVRGTSVGLLILQPLLRNGAKGDRPRGGCEDVVARSQPVTAGRG